VHVTWSPSDLPARGYTDYEETTDDGDSGEQLLACCLTGFGEVVAKIRQKPGSAGAVTGVDGASGRATPGMIAGAWTGAWNPGVDGFCSHGGKPFGSNIPLGGKATGTCPVCCGPIGTCAG
jgi:hypothetical protein